MLDFIKNKPLTFLSGIYLLFSWAMFVLRLRFGLPPFSMSIIVGVLLLAAIGDATGISQLNIGARLSAGHASPEINLLLMVVLALLAIHTVERMSKSIHEYLESG